MFGCYVKDPTLTYKAVQMSISWKNKSQVVGYCQAARLHKRDQTKIFNLSLNEDYFILQILAILAQKWYKIARCKKRFFVFVNPLATHSGGVSQGRDHGSGCWR